MWFYRFTLRDTETGKHAEIFSTSHESWQFADEAFKAGWERFYSGGFQKHFEVTRCIVAQSNATPAEAVEQHAAYNAHLNALGCHCPDELLDALDDAGWERLNKARATCPYHSKR